MVSPIKDKRDSLFRLVCQSFTHKLGPTWPVVKMFETLVESYAKYKPVAGELRLHVAGGLA